MTEVPIRFNAQSGVVETDFNQRIHCRLVTEFTGDIIYTQNKYYNFCYRNTLQGELWEGHHASGHTQEGGGLCHLPTAPQGFSR